MSLQTNTPVQQPSRHHIVDVIFRIRCRGLPSDHAHELRGTLCERLPWLTETGDYALIPVRGAASGNGWQRPDGENKFIHLSRRAFFGLRLPHDKATRTESLVGENFNVCDERVTVTHSKIKSLSFHSTLSARHLALPDVDNETAFLAAATDCLRMLNIGVDAPKTGIISGQRTTVRTASGRVPVRNLMVSDLTPEASLRLQKSGIGNLMTWGCGVFLPHKGIAPVWGAGHEHHIQH